MKETGTVKLSSMTGDSGAIQDKWEQIDPKGLKDF